MHRDAIDAALAARMVAAQFPEWSDLPVVPVERPGWDNRTFRLGDAMSVRLPSAAAYVPSVQKEHTCRAEFRRLMPADAAMWARARGWALWKALITIDNPNARPDDAAEAARVAEEVLAEHRDAR